MAERINRRGLRNCEQNPKSTRSAVRRWGARRGDRRITKSCCLRMRFSASTALIPPLPRTVIRPASRRRIGQNQYSISITLPASTSKASKGRSGCRGTATANSHVQADKLWRLALLRMDLRKYEVKAQMEDGRQLIGPK